MDLTRTIRLWAAALIIVGVIDLSGAILDPARYGTRVPLWPIVEILTGAAGFYFTVPAILPAFALLLIWDDILDLLAGTLDLWAIIGLLIAAWIGRDYVRLQRRIRELEATAAEKSGAQILNRGRQALPLASLAIGLITLPMMGLLLVYLNTAFLPGQPRPPAAIWSVPGLVSLATAGIGLGLGSLRAGYPFRVSAAIGVACSILTFLSIVAVFVFNAFLSG